MNGHGASTKKAVVAACTLAAVGLLGTGTAAADHVHSKETGNGSCVLLARNGGEKEVQLPFAPAGNRAHPLHVLVHLGRAGENFDIGVYGRLGSDPCFLSGEYVND